MSSPLCDDVQVERVCPRRKGWEGREGGVELGVPGKFEQGLGAAHSLQDGRPEDRALCTGDKDERPGT